MNSKPILFSAPMVRALLEGRKTQTRRVVKNPFPYSQCVGIKQHGDEWLQILTDGEGQAFTLGNINKRLSCPYGKPGDLLWVRETFLYRNNRQNIICSADYSTLNSAGVGALYGGWKPSIHMPRWASRLTLEITGIRVERLQDISEEDAIAEGIEPKKLRHFNGEGFDGWNCYTVADSGYENPIHSYESLWKSINGRDSWAANPWVWVIEFKAHKQNIGAYIRGKNV